jgi:alpha-N-arabinofuranosidase
VGDIAARKTQVNRWNDEFDHRPTPDYFQSFGLGFYEYFQLAEDIGARPLPVLNCGMACEFNTSETASLEQEKEYIQDALDLIEFANGPVSSPWGKLRAQMGHPTPFHMEMLGVGNEQWGPRYIERYKLFAAALRAQHPEIQLVASVGFGTEGPSFDAMWQAWRQLKPDVVDEHYYLSPAWYMANTGRYDHYDRSGPKVYIGEYSAQTAGIANPNNRNNWIAAISEAAFMTGLERNGDVVRLASYAGLMANVDAWQFTPDAIWFDSLRSYGTPNYYVQKVFASNVGTRIVPSTPHAEKGLYTSATLDERTHELILTVVNATASALTADVGLGDSRIRGTAKTTTLESASPNEENSFDRPEAIAPIYSTTAVDAGSMVLRLKGYSVNVYRIPMPSL